MKPSAFEVRIEYLRRHAEPMTEIYLLHECSSRTRSVAASVVPLFTTAELARTVRETRANASDDSKALDTLEALLRA